MTRRPAKTGRNYLMSELKRINRLIADLERRLAGGDMTYTEAVTVDHLISVFERMASEIETDRLAPPHPQRPRSRSM